MSNQPVPGTQEEPVLEESPVEEAVVEEAIEASPVLEAAPVPVSPIEQVSAAMTAFSDQFNAYQNDKTTLVAKLAAAEAAVDAATTAESVSNVSQQGLRDGIQNIKSKLDVLDASL